MISRERWRSPHGEEWFDWFAWHPVRTEPPDDRWIWLEWVQKRYRFGFTYHPPDYRERPLSQKLKRSTSREPNPNETQPD